MPSYYDYDDYHSIIDNSDELYSYDDDQWDYGDVESKEWENYYHNITDEIIDE